MRNFPQEIPARKEMVIAYLDNGKYMFCQFRKVLTWRGYQERFVNLLSPAGLWADNVLGWNKIPKREDTF